MNFAQKLVGDEEERAVSPVIGVILMVAITVILAAVIAAFVLDMGTSLSSEAQGAATIDGDGTEEVTVTAESLANADGIAIIAPDGTLLEASHSDYEVAVDGADNPLKSVGTSVTFSGDVADGTSSSSEEFNVIAYDGATADQDDRSGENVIGSFTLENVVDES